MKKSLIIALCCISTFYATHTADKELPEALIQLFLLDELKDKNAKDPRFQPTKQKARKFPGFNPFYCKENF